MVYMQKNYTDPPELILVSQRTKEFCAPYPHSTSYKLCIENILNILRFTVNIFISSWRTVFTCTGNWQWWYVTQYENAFSFPKFWPFVVLLFVLILIIVNYHESPLLPQLPIRIFIHDNSVYLWSNSTSPAWSLQFTKQENLPVPREANLKIGFYSAPLCCL